MWKRSIQVGDELLRNGMQGLEKSLDIMLFGPWNIISKKVLHVVPDIFDDVYVLTLGRPRQQHPHGSWHGVLWG